MFMTKFFISFFICLCAHTSALADSFIRGEPIRVEREFVYGNVKIVQIFDSKTTPGKDDYIIKIFNHGELLAQYRGISFQHLAAIRNNTIFIGTSNYGYPARTAIVVFTDRGELRMLLAHDLINLDFCEKSVTITRLWIDEENPDFKEEDGDLTYRNCRGDRVSFSKTIAKVFNMPDLKASSRSSD